MPPGSRRPVPPAPACRGAGRGSSATCPGSAVDDADRPITPGSDPRLSVSICGRLSGLSDHGDLLPRSLPPKLTDYKSYDYPILLRFKSFPAGPTRSRRQGGREWGRNLIARRPAIARFQGLLAEWV